MIEFHSSFLTNKTRLRSLFELRSDLIILMTSLFRVKQVMIEFHSSFLTNKTRLRSLFELRLDLTVLMTSLFWIKQVMIEFYSNFLTNKMRSRSIWYEPRRVPRLRQRAFKLVIMYMISVLNLRKEQERAGNVCQVVRNLYEPRAMNMG